MEDTREDEVPAISWFQKNLDIVPDAMSQLLKTYSGIQAEDVRHHIVQIREQAWKITPYPCIGRWMFLQLNMSLNPVYPEALRRLQHRAKLLDLGCGLGQDIRKLIHDGAPARDVYGCDASQGLIDADYDLFRDRSTLPNAIIVADAFDSEACMPPGSEAEVDIVAAGSIFHLFGWQEQLEVAERIVGCMRSRPGLLVFGHHLGHVHAGTYPFGLDSGKMIFKHDEASFKRL